MMSNGRSIQLATPYEIATALKWRKREELRPAKPGSGRPSFWDVPGKIEAGRRIAREELERHAGHHNDREDALRHATWSKRMAEEIGPVFSTLAGAQHEIEGLLPRWDTDDGAWRRGQPWGEAAMDMNNNLEGVAAATGGRAIKTGNLVDRPGAARNAYPTR